MLGWPDVGQRHGEKLAARVAIVRDGRVIDIEEANITPVRNQQNDYLNEVGKLDGELISLITLAPLTLAAKRQMK